MSMRAGFSSSAQPRSTYLMPGIGIVGVVGGVRVIHGHDVGQHRRPHIIVVVGGDAHELRALDQEGRMADIADAHLIGRRARRAETRRAPRTAAGGHQARAAFGHFRLCRRRRRALRRGLARRGQDCRKTAARIFSKVPAHDIDPRHVQRRLKSDMVLAGSPLASRTNEIAAPAGAPFDRRLN